MSSESKIDVCIITKDARAKCGLERYTSLLVNALKSDSCYSVILIEPTKIGPLAISVSQKKIDHKTTILHFRSQELASPLIFYKYPKTIVTVHDIIPLEYPLYEQATHLRAKKFDKWFFRKTIKALERAERIITVSEATKKSLLKHISYPEERIHVIYEYPSKEFKEIKTIHEEKKKQKTCDVLYVGSEMPYKNLTVLLHAIAAAKKKIPQVRLIKVGKALWPGAREELEALASTLGIEDVIVWKDEVEKIEEEYNRATVLIQPSLHEGFGFPIVEAMACGCPVICSNRTSLPELGGDAVLYFDPTNQYELAEKIMNILENKKMQEELRKKGLKQVKKFTKERFDRETKQVYELVEKSVN